MLRTTLTKGNVPATLNAATSSTFSPGWSNGGGSDERAIGRSGDDEAITRVPRLASSATAAVSLIAIQLLRIVPLFTRDERRWSSLRSRTGSIAGYRVVASARRNAAGPPGKVVARAIRGSLVVVSSVPDDWLTDRAFPGKIRPRIRRKILDRSRSFRRLPGRKHAA